jgi:hypothetical protein
VRRLEIGKGTSRKLYFPDYLVVLAGMPVLVIEAKAPGEDLDEALAEARLYGNEVNALFPSGVNPCGRVLASDGRHIVSSPIVTASQDIRLAYDEVSAASISFARLTDVCQKDALQHHADAIRRKFRPSKFMRAVNQIGGPAFQNEELPSNTFGATISGDYGHLFNPRTKEDRERVARHAYIASVRRQRYIEPIDRLIRGAVSPTTNSLRAFEDTSKPLELTRPLSERRKLENQTVLLIGSVGSGKSTFMDYVSMVALPEELRKRTVWVRINLNEAPLAPSVAYSWLADAIIDELRQQPPVQDVYDLKVLEKIFTPEIMHCVRDPLLFLTP